MLYTAGRTSLSMELEENSGKDTNTPNGWQASLDNPWAPSSMIPPQKPKLKARDTLACRNIPLPTPPPHTHTHGGRGE